jgi:hypothetical protein
VSISVFAVFAALWERNAAAGRFENFDALLYHRLLAEKEVIPEVLEKLDID